MPVPPSILAPAGMPLPKRVMGPTVDDIWFPTFRAESITASEMVALMGIHANILFLFHKKSWRATGGGGREGAQ
jgi:hypothetical protein